MASDEIQELVHLFGYSSNLEDAREVENAQNQRPICVNKAGYIHAIQHSTTRLKNQFQQLIL